MKCHLLLFSTLTVIRGICAANSCLEGCQVDGDGLLNLGMCGITDADIAAGDLAACFVSAGEANVLELSLSSNQLTTLPVGIFDQLSNLQGLFLNDNQLTTLSVGLFDQLANLADLNLSGNQLTTLPFGLFDQLSNLGSLILGNNQLTTLPVGLFDQLSNLERLILGFNQLTTLPFGLFDQLSNLGFLFLTGNNALECLPSTRDGANVISPVSLGECGCTLADGTNPCGEVACTPGEDGFTCEPPVMNCPTDFVCDGALVDKDDKENQVCATSTCTEDDCCDARSCSDYACSTGEEVPVVLQETLCSTTAGDANECSDDLCCVNCFTEVTCNPKSARPINSGAPCSGGRCNRGQCCVGE